MLHRALAPVVASLLVSLAAFVQFEAGYVVGIVKDPAGLAMANAIVEIRSLATNVTRKSVTSATGDFDFVALQPGRYALTAKQPGFKETTQNFELSVGQRVEL